ncbi:hypothetical protein BDR04DRAFT_1233026 [Suillus decipiens]|nr:hypothetical protein BDR04DRAFT_1233026 [Suillus decipiens]
MSFEGALINVHFNTLAMTDVPGWQTIGQTYDASNLGQVWIPSTPRDNSVALQNASSGWYLSASNDKKTVVTSDTAQLWKVQGDLNASNPVALQLPDEQPGGYYTATMTDDHKVALVLVPKDQSFSDSQLWTPLDK